MHQFLADATFQVICGDSAGSGFSFLREDIVVTNYHVISPFVNLDIGKTTGNPILICEDGERLNAKIVQVDVDNDFAIMQLLSHLPSERTVLQPCAGFTPLRGRKLIFAGYPHGLPQLLTNEAIISAPLENGKFAIDGMVNGGNSGGPIIDRDTGEVIGIVTQRRYMMGDQAISFNQEIEELRQYLADVSQHTRVEIMGVNFSKMADMFGRSLQIVSDMMSQNANPGIGIGFSMQPIIDAISNIKA